MKKSVILGVLGLAACAATSFGQGYISLDNYNFTGGIATYSAGVPQNGVSGTLGTVGAGLRSGWTAGLYWALTTGITDPAGNGTPLAPLQLGTGGNQPGATTGIFDSSFGTAGQFLGSPYFAIPGGTVGQVITLEIVAYNTSAGSYANAAAAGWRGHSAPFTITLMVGNAAPPTANVGPLFSSFNVSAVPEPATLALAGLGGLASLVMLRRKQA